MANKPLPTPEVLRQLMTYDPETGKLFWKERGPEQAAWNRAWAGKETFTAPSGHGYRVGHINGSKYYAHRVAFAYVHGKWPDAHIDHINGDRADNRLSNLRPATNSENMRNMSAPRSNKSGAKGVSWSSARMKWEARIRTDAGSKFLGYFDTVHEAAEAYRRAALEFHGAFARVGD